jgi:hypothetical protein
VTRAAAAVLVGALALSAAGNARAYCRTSSCNEGTPHTAAVCDPPQPDDCGTPIFWPNPCTEFSVQENGSPKLGITAVDLAGIMTTAFGTWESASCSGGGTPLMVITEGPEAVCQQHEYNQMAGNANIIMFHDDAWPYEGSPNTLALTTVTYNQDNGQIYDADMELNSADNHFTTGNTNVDFDLPSIVTHESGHFQGLAHSHDPAATMWPQYVEHTTNLRHISPDDIAAICAVYPPGPADPACDPTPRHGFSAYCAGTAENQLQSSTSGCCAVAPGSQPATGRHAALLAALGALALELRGLRRRA